MHPFAKIKRIPFSVPNILDDYHDGESDEDNNKTIIPKRKIPLVRKRITRPIKPSTPSTSTSSTPSTPFKRFKSSTTPRPFWNAKTRYIVPNVPPVPLVPLVPQYVEFCEYNGWEMETWRTYIPYAPNVKLLSVLNALLTRLNRHHALHVGHRERHNKDKQHIQDLAKHNKRMHETTNDSKYVVRQACAVWSTNEPIPCAMCTKYTLKLDQRHTRNEVRIRIDTFEDDAMYTDHVIMPEEARLDRNKLGQMCKWARLKKNVDQAMDKVHTTLYKNGIRKLFI